MSTWQEHRNEEGRLYWYSAATSESVWDKPEELQTPRERAIATTPWKPYQTAENRTYYVHATSGETQWEEPDEVKEALSKLPPEVHIQPAALAIAAAPLTAQTGALVGAGSIVPIGLPEKPNDAAADYSTTEDATKAFMNLLRSVGVNPTWSWEQTMRRIVTDPVYKALRTLAERRAAFERYIEDYRKRERETRERNLERIRPAWREGLGRATEGEGGMKSWWSWERSRQALSEGLPEMWRMARDEDERRILWEEYVGDIKRKEDLREREIRQSNLDKFNNLLQKLSLDLGTPWTSARRNIERSAEWTNDVELRQIAPTDMLAAFEEVVRQLERQANDDRQKAKEERRRRARKARQGFISLLHELRMSQHITAATQWKDIFPLIENEERYRKVLGKPGSTPIELFWDVVDELDAQVEEDQRLLGPAMERVGLRVEGHTTFDAFDTALRQDAAYQALDSSQREAVFVQLSNEAKRTAKEERRKNERQLRNQMDDFRYALRKVEPSISADTSYEQALAAFHHLPEYAAISEESSRRAAFDKYISRLKDKLKEREASDAGSRAGSPHSTRARREQPRATSVRAEGADDQRASDVRDRSRDRSHRSNSKRERERDEREDSDRRRHSATSRHDRRRDGKRHRGDDMEEGEI